MHLPSLKIIPVSLLKAKLLAVIREVENGQVFEVTKGSKPVAMLQPIQLQALPAVGFSQVEILGDLNITGAKEWSFDQENLPHGILTNSKKKKPRANRS